ncbi:MAG: hypothetical protein R3A48_10650 [Polyangiales bacterium]
MSDENSAEAPPPQPAAPSPKKPPTALVVAGLAVTTLIVGVTLLRGRAPTPSPHAAPPRSAPAASEREGGVEASDPTPPENSQSLADTVGPATSEVLALFAPLRVGSDVGSGRIEQISDVVDGRVMVSVRRGDATQLYGVMLHSAAAADLRRAGPYVLYVHGVARPEFRDALDAIVAAIEANARRGGRTLSDLRPFARDEPRN